MTYASTRPRRNRTIALACATAVAAAGLTQTGAVASTVHAAAAPSVSNLVVAPKSPTKGKGFKVSFKTKAGGTYEVFYSTGQSGDLLVSGKTKTGTITTKRLGKKIHAGKITVGVRVTVGTKSKDATKPVTIKK
jgi:nitrous oxide reductase